MSIVVDASAAAAAIVNDDEDGEWAAALLNGEDIHAPDLFFAEAVNIIRKMEHSDRLSVGDAVIAHADLMRLPVELHGYAPFAKRIWELRHNVTPYDAWYVAIAEKLDAPLVTLDGHLANAPGPRCEFLVPPYANR